MDEISLKKMLEEYRLGRLNQQEVISKLQTLPFESLSHARVDHHRKLRCGYGEVIFCQNKTPQQVCEIFARLAAEGDVLATRATAEMYEAVKKVCAGAVFYPISRAIIMMKEQKRPCGLVAIVSAGTSDMAVAEEARLTAEFMGAEVSCHYDVGVAGLHRLLADLDDIRKANAVVAVAGMEGALASVIGGLVSVPLIAVPTSVGYGASFGGVAALLAMLNSCAAGVSVVNIDNGFAGGYNAALINRLAVRKR
ncbi:MAG TPA: nickel pincer cofactor biosynthesis protein LarB [Phycisphaerae bacterium]|nr:nickel pincer cofactor biosynthesis protein LarB [Phycisphaerae bacterium]